MSEGRVAWADYAKVLCIYLVTLVHTPMWHPLNVAINAFIIPAFFFFSGYFFSYDRHPSWLPFVKRRARQLLVPYFSLAMISYVFWLLVGRHYGDDARAGVEWYSPLVATVLGYGKQMVQSVPLWFVMTLFVLECLFWPVGRLFRRNQVVMLAVLALAGWGSALVADVRVPFYLCHAVAGLVFFAAGMVFRDVKLTPGRSLVLFAAGCAAYALSLVYNTSVVYIILQFGNWWLFLLGGLGATLALVVACRWLASVAGSRAWVQYVGRNTIVVCGLHIVMFTLVKGVMVYVLGIPLSVLDDSVVPCLLLGAAGMACCVPVMYVLDRYAPFLLGRGKK